MVKKKLISLAVGAALMATGTSAFAQQRLVPLIPPPQQIAQQVAQQQVAQLVCLSQEDGRAALSSARVLSLAQALQIAGISGEVVSYQLCQLNGAYVYQINVLGQGGVVSRYVVDAMSGIVLPA